MSHSQLTKRGRSQYVEVWNPRAKLFIHSCGLCGRIGFSPGILDEGFADTYEKQAIRSSLQSVLEPLHLDEQGRCAICAAHTPDACA